MFVYTYFFYCATREYLCCLCAIRRPSLSSMVRTYQRRGGHGGARSGAGNKPGHWEGQGGRVAAAIAKAERSATAKAEAEAMKRKAQDRWRLWAASSSTQQSSSEQQQPAKPAADTKVCMPFRPNILPSSLLPFSVCNGCRCGHNLSC